MNSSRDIYFIASPKDAEHILNSRCKLACLGYKITANEILFPRSMLSKYPNSLMVINIDFPPKYPYSDIIHSIISECSEKKYSGIVIDTANVNTSIIGFINTLYPLVKQNSIHLYLPEKLSSANCDYILISTAISGGSLRSRLIQAKSSYKHIALDIERSCEDFVLPSPSGAGTSWQFKDLYKFIRNHETRSFFSRELCCKYFVYKNSGKYHVVLYDDASTIHTKLKYAHELGITKCFLLYPEIADIKNELDIYHIR